MRLGWLVLVLCSCNPTGADDGADMMTMSTITPDVTTPAGLCAAFIACSGKASPGTLGMVLATFGDKGSCWSAQSAAFCDDACKNGIVALHRTQDVPACNVCFSDDDCPAQFAARCDLGTHQCFGCTDASDCRASVYGRRCDTTRRACVACLDDSQCSAPNAPRCDSATGACVECLDSSDCFNNAASDICVQNRCAPCTSDAQCAAVSANYPLCARGTCVQCRAKSDCANNVNGPYCRDGACACVKDTDCAAPLKCPTQSYCQ